MRTHRWYVSTRLVEQGSLVGVTMLVALTVLVALPAEARGQDAPKNLQYFPADMSRREVVQEMRQFSFALGVRCQYCHVGGDGRSFEGVVFESDEDPDKRKARFMLRLVDTLNEGLLPMMADRDQPESRITCKTCHRGRPKPALLTDVLLATLNEHGADSTRAQYVDLRENFGLAGMYDFGEWEMNTLADRLGAEERYEDAVAIYELNLEYHSESVSILLSLGRLHEQMGQEDEAIRRYRQALEVAPEHPFATQRLEALVGGGGPGGP